MKVSLVDLREFNSNVQDDIDSLLSGNDSTAVILVSHGSRQSIDGFTAETFPRFPSAKVIWLYACNCGKLLIRNIADSHGSAIVFGYTTNVLAPTTGALESTVAGSIRKFLEDYSGPHDSNMILGHVQGKLLERALSEIEMAKTKRDGRMLLGAALTNHTRLSLRFAEPSVTGQSRQE